MKDVLTERFDLMGLMSGHLGMFYFRVVGNAEVRLEGNMPHVRWD